MAAKPNKLGRCYTKSKMREYQFTLKFRLSDRTIDPAVHIEKLIEVGCGDAMIGFEKRGHIRLDFNRESTSAVRAFSSAISEVKAAIPNVVLLDLEI